MIQENPQGKNPASNAMEFNLAFFVFTKYIKLLFLISMLIVIAVLTLLTFKDSNYEGSVGLVQVVTGEDNPTSLPLGLYKELALSKDIVKNVISSFPELTEEEITIERFIEAYFNAEIVKREDTTIKDSFLPLLRLSFIWSEPELIPEVVNKWSELVRKRMVDLKSGEFKRLIETYDFRLKSTNKTYVQKTNEFNKKLLEWQLDLKQVELEQSKSTYRTLIIKLESIKIDLLLKEASYSSSFQVLTTQNTSDWDTLILLLEGRLLAAQDLLQIATKNFEKEDKYRIRRTGIPDSLLPDTLKEAEKKKLMDAFTVEESNPVYETLRQQCANLQNCVAAYNKCLEHLKTSREKRDLESSDKISPDSAKAYLRALALARRAYQLFSRAVGGGKKVLAEPKSLGELKAYIDELQITKKQVAECLENQKILIKNLEDKVLNIVKEKEILSLELLRLKGTVKDLSNKLHAVSINSIEVKADFEKVEEPVVPERPLPRKRIIYSLITFVITFIVLFMFFLMFEIVKYYKENLFQTKDVKQTSGDKVVSEEVELISTSIKETK